VVRSSIVSSIISSCIASFLGLYQSRRYATSTKLTGEKLRHFTNGIGTRCWLGTDGGATAPTGFVPVAHLRANVYRIIRGIKAMVSVGIDFEAHRSTKCLGALGPLHAWRCRGPVILGTDKHEQRRVGPVVWSARIGAQTTWIERDGSTEVALWLALIEHHTQDCPRAVGPTYKANPVRLDIGALADELQGAAGIVSTVVYHREFVAACADLVDATGCEAIHKERDIAMVPEVLGPKAGI
jgi:hypothetical protein